MDNITKGDPIKADWANALTNAVNAAAHGKTALRGGGGQNVFISPYQRGSRPLAFDLVEITDDEEGSLSGKKVALFGSYGWGDGEWMRSWESRCDDAGANMVCDSVICNETPDDEALSACRELGAALA